MTTKCCPICQEEFNNSIALKSHYEKELSLYEGSININEALTELLQQPDSQFSFIQEDQEFQQFLEGLKQNSQQRRYLTFPANEPGGGERGGEFECFICGLLLPTQDISLLQEHVEECLEQQEELEAPLVEFEEYEWAGLQRTRSIRILPFTSSSSRSGTGLNRDINEEVVIVDDCCDDLDAQDYGDVQFSDLDLINPPVVATAEVTKGEEIRDDPITEAITGKEGDGLIIAALKEKIRQQERLINASAAKCMICLEPHQLPLTSTVCWHVFCQACWLNALKEKKLCPQCQAITQPHNLRRVYL